MALIATRLFRISACLLLTAVAAVPAAAMRFAFSAVDATEKQVDGAEVCVTRAVTAGVGHWLGSDDVRCHSATTILAFPPGYWAVYGVKRGEYVSTHPYFIPVGGDPADTDSGFKTIQLNLVPAVALPLPARAGDDARSRLVLYFPGTAETMTFSLPLSADDTMATVPRDADFVAFRVSEGRVVGIARPRWTPDGTGDLVFAPAAKLAVIGALRTPRLRRDDLASALSPPDISLTTAEGVRFRSVLPRQTIRDHDLLLFENVPRDTHRATIHVAGATYEPVQEPFDIDARTAGVVSAQPVHVIPAGELVVSLPADAADFLRGTTARCDTPSEASANAEWNIVLDGCGGEASCRRLERRSLDPLLRGEEMRFEGITVGTYELRIENGSRRALWREPLVARAGTASVALSPRLSRVVGSVRRAGAPVHARVAVADGATVTAEDGTYSLVFSTAKAPARIELLTCDGGQDPYTVFPETPLTHMAAIDIELPAPVELTVVEAGTRLPVAGAKVWVTVAEQTSRAILLNEPAPATDRDGKTRVSNPPAGRSFVLCARTEAHEESCGEPKDGALTLALQKIATQSGRIEGVVEVNGGMLFFVAASGETTELVGVARDGTFRFRYPHGPQERAIFVSGNYPLAAIAIPATGAAELKMPAGRVRMLTVRSTPSENHEIGLALGGTIVPSAALSRHQAFRGLSTVTRDGQLVLRDFVESGRTVVYRGYSRATRPPTIPIQVDVFTSPELRRALAWRPADGDSVSFD